MLLGIPKDFLGTSQELPRTSYGLPRDFLGLPEGPAGLAPQIIVTSEPSNSKSTSSSSVNDFLKKDGFVSQVTKFEYAERKEQIAFSQKIEECHVSANTFVIEAGTGIGKTIGYLVPSLISANRTYIATHTKSLQDQ